MVFLNEFCSKPFALLLACSDIHHAPEGLMTHSKMQSKDVISGLCGLLREDTQLSARPIKILSCANPFQPLLSSKDSSISKSSGKCGGYLRPYAVSWSQLVLRCQGCRVIAPGQSPHQAILINDIKKIFLLALGACLPEHAQPSMLSHELMEYCKVGSAAW